MQDKPSNNESEFIAKIEFEKLKKLEEESTKGLIEKEKLEIKQLHYMRCPKCGMQLIELAYDQIKIDKCSSCEGIWLDAGELDEIMNDSKGMLQNFLSIFHK
ncbi:MAG TPA: zf-TFIIB domain-containing protein [Nitrospinota bacterium]|nr:zf-TFIIB domain-containing protein [Nitrospinota bacterium]|tara:strand:+ start:45802 stop:46107 length:306 start_codon:yes stop_codon:yes gene_type:complete